MDKAKLQSAQAHSHAPTQRKSPFGAHPMEADGFSPHATTLQAKRVGESAFDPTAAMQLEKVGPEDIPANHVGYEYVAKLAYQEAADIQGNPATVNFLTKFGYDPAGVRVTHGKSGFAMLYVPSVDTAAHPHIVAFRGTELNDLGDLGTDIDLAYVGKTQFKNNKEVIENTMKEAGSPVALLGHSLGGAIAQKVASEYGGSVKETVTFQAPGLGLFDKQEPDPEVEHPPATHHVSKHDLVDRAGFHHLPGDVYVHDGSWSVLSAHTDPVFSTSQFAEEREKLGISTTTDVASGVETDNVLGEEIRQQDPDKNHIKRREDYPGYRTTTGLVFEGVRSAAGAVKGVVGKGVDGVKGAFNGGKKLFGKLGEGIKDIFDGQEDKEAEGGR